MKPAAIALCGLVSLSLLAPCRAQDLPRVRMSCGDVVRMGLLKFQKHFSDVTHDDSTAGMIAACEQYYHCRRQVNDANVRALSARRRQQVVQVRAALDALAEAGDSYTYIEAGGGTMWGPIAADAHAEREDFVATLIAELRRPASGSRADRRNADSSLQTARKTLATLASPQWPDPAFATPGVLQDYKHTYADARAAFTRLQTLIRALPDAPAHHVAREVAKILTAPSEELKPDVGIR